MRHGIKENKILDETFLVCAEIVGKQMVHKGRGPEISALCKKISSSAISGYLSQALDLIEYAYEPEYIDIVLEYEYQNINKSEINSDELKTLVILNKMITKFIQKKDVDFFYNIYSQECSDVIRDTLSAILKYE